MKKIVILSMLLLLISLPGFALRSYFQKVVADDPAVDLLTLATSTLSSYTAPNYLVTADIVETVGEVLSTGVTVTTSLRLNKTGNGTTVPFYNVVFVQLSTFPTPFINGQTLRINVTKTDVVGNPSVTWDQVIPSGTAAINITTPVQRIPPMTPAVVDVFNTVTLVAPTMDATGVAYAPTMLDWAYVTGAGWITPTWYKVRFANTEAGLQTATPVWVNAAMASDYPLASTPATHYYWQVMPTTEVPPIKGATPSTSRANVGSRADGSWSAVWHFTTDNAPVLTYDATINSNIPGVLIYDGGISTGFTAPHTFTFDVGTTHTMTVQDIPTQVEPVAIDVTAAGTYSLNYTNPPNTTGGGTGGGAAYTATGGPVVVPSVTGTSVSGTVNAPGVLVITTSTPGKATVDGYNNVYQYVDVWASDQAMLNGANFDFDYTPKTAKYFAFHWGGPANGFYPAPPTSGYAFNGGAAHAPGYGTIASAIGGWTWNGTLLSVATIPTFAAKAEGTFRLYLSNGDLDLPVVLSAFNAVATAQMFVNLQWTTESETNNLGFNVLRSTTSNVANAEQVNFGIIAGTNSATTQTYNFVDNGVAPEATYYYWLEMVNFDGTSNFSNFVMVTTTGVTPPPVVPNTTVLRNAYPNPFNVNTLTNIEMDVKNGETATLTIYNVLGQSVKTYVRTAGSHKITWNGRDNNGAVCGSGIYFYKLSSASVNTTKKMVVVK